MYGPLRSPSAESPPMSRKARGAARADLPLVEAAVGPSDRLAEMSRTPAPSHAEGPPDTTSVSCASACHGERLGREGEVHDQELIVGPKHQREEVAVLGQAFGVLEPLRDRHLEH